MVEFVALRPTPHQVEFLALRGIAPRRAAQRPSPTFPPLYAAGVVAARQLLPFRNKTLVLSFFVIFVCFCSTLFAQVDLDILLDGNAAHYINGLGVPSVISGAGLGDVSAGNVLTNQTAVVAAGSTILYATNAAGFRAVIGLVLGTDVEAFNTNLLRLATISSVSGDVLYRDASGWTNLAKGADATILTLASGLPAWTALDADLIRLAAITSASGDILYRDAVGWTNLAKGANGAVLNLASGFPAWSSRSRFAVATNYTIATTDFYIAATATLTNTLPAASTILAGRQFIVKDVSSHTITVRPAGADTIDGVAGDDTLTNKLCRIYFSDGVSNWEVK